MKDNLFDLASSLRSVKVTVDGNEILSENILDLEIHWNAKSFEVQASMILKDNQDILSFFSDFNKKIVNIFVNDIEDSNMSRDFYIAHMQEASGDQENTKTLVITLIDVISFTLKNSYISKGYSGKTLKFIIDDVFKIFKIDSLYNSKYILKDFSETEPVYEAIVIPQDRSVLDFINFQLNQEGAILFQQKDGIYLRNIAEIYPSVLKVDSAKVFKEDVENPNYGFKILDLSAEYSSAYDNLKLPAKTTFMYNPNKKIMEKLSKNVSEIWDKIKTTNIDEKYVQSTDLVNGGTRYHTKEVNSPLNELAKETYFFYLENTLVEIFVSGNVSGNKLLEKRSASFKGSTLHIKGMTEGNVLLGGDYIVLSIHDKILSEKMISKVVLGRVNNTGKIEEKAK